MRLAACLAALAGMSAAACSTVEPPTHVGDPAEGQKVAQELCASCHAIGPAGESPNRAATPFRSILQGYGSDALVRDLDNALSINHLKMPTFYMGDDQPEDIAAYLKTIQVPTQ